MNYVQKTVQFVKMHFSRKNTAVVMAALTVLTAAGYFIPNQQHGDVAAENVQCANAPGDNRPHLNTFPVKWNGTNTPTQNSDGTYTCYDFPFMVGRNVNGNFPTSQTQHTNGVNAQVGDTVQIRLYVHNSASAQSDPNLTAARNVTIDTSYTNGNGVATVRASASASNASERPSGSVKVNLPSGASLELIPNSGVIQKYDGSYGRTDFQIGDNSVELFDSLEGCFEKSKFIYYKFRIVGSTIPTGQLQIEKNVRNVTRSTSFADQTTARTNDTVEYQIRVSATNAAVNNVTVTDTGAAGISMNAGSLRLNGSTVSGSLSGLSIGNVSTTSPAIITYTARVTSTQCNANLVNTARASASGVTTVQDTATVMIECEQIPQLICTPDVQSVQVNQNASFTANGGNGTYSWSANGGSPSTGNLRTFVTRYATTGTKTVTVTSGSQTATCTVIVSQTPPPPSPVVCVPTSQTVDINQTANLSASGGNGSYTWSAPGGSPSTGSTQGFATQYGTSGTKFVTVTSNGQTATCTVIVRQPQIPQLVCAPDSQTVDINQYATFTASGGNGSYTWSAPGGSPSTGNQQGFQTRYGSAGTRSVTVSSAGMTDTCTVIVREANIPDVVCVPDIQTVNINEFAYFVASGGNGSYVWSANDGSPSTGSNQSFNTRYASAGTKTVTVSSAGKTDTCTVIVREAQTPDVVCVPDHQTTDINDTVSFSATGGNGSYTWSAPGGNPTSGNQQNFTTKYSTSGTKTVTVSSGGKTDYCTVSVREIVISGNPRLSIEKSVKNITQGTEFRNSVNANHNDRVQFEVEIRNTGSEDANNVVMTDDFPSQLTLDTDSIRVDGSKRSVSSSNFSISLGTLEPSERIRITFEAKVKADHNATIRNVAKVRASNASSDEDDAYVYVNVVAGNPSLQLSKKVLNDRTGQVGTVVTAERDDYLTYTLTVTNTGNAASNNFIITDDLSGVLAFASMADNGGGTLNGKVLTFSGVTIPAGGSVSKTFRVHVMHNLNQSQAYVLQNTYGNLVTVNVPGKAVYIAPKTGSSGMSAVVFAGLLTSGFVAVRKRRQLMGMIFA
jgi:uncharacterized repeat protein (TIGR01451 family)/LPXTG-motif cell wall-anchored protein